MHHDELHLKNPKNYLKTHPIKNGFLSKINLFDYAQSLKYFYWRITTSSSRFEPLFRPNLEQINLTSAFFKVPSIILIKLQDRSDLHLFQSLMQSCSVFHLH